MASGAIGSALVSYFHTGTAFPMAALLLASAVVSLVLQAGYRITRSKLLEIPLDR